MADIAAGIMLHHGMSWLGIFAFEGSVTLLACRPMLPSKKPLVFDEADSSDNDDAGDKQARRRPDLGVSNIQLDMAVSPIRLQLQLRDVLASAAARPSGARLCSGPDHLATAPLATTPLATESLATTPLAPATTPALVRSFQPPSPAKVLHSSVTAAFATSTLAPADWPGWDAFEGILGRRLTSTPEGRCQDSRRLVVTAVADLNAKARQRLPAVLRHLQPSALDVGLPAKRKGTKAAL